MSDASWVYCPVCGGKTRTQVNPDTVLENFPLYCPKCKRVSLIDLKNQEMTVIEEPDA